MDAPKDLPEPQTLTEPAKPAKKNVKPALATRIWWPQVIVAAVLCMASSGLTTWGLLASGVVKPVASSSVADSPEKLVLQEGDVVADVFKKISPSTVAINTEARTTARNFFGTTGIEQGAGSGVIISGDGYILTNRHVIPEGTSKVTVVLADGRELTDVKVIGRDPLNDVAFLKVQGEKNLPAATIGDSGLVQPGQRVVAIGNALGEFRNSVTAGIISGLGRPIEAADGQGSSEKLENLFQTDAAINPGNSGGPLVNLKGEVIGINTAIAEEAQAIGFAIPINDAKGMIKTVLEKGQIIKPYLGVRYVSLTTELAKRLGISATKGAYVGGGDVQDPVMAGSPADKAGIRARDLITKVNNKQITDTSTLASLLAQYAPGDKVSLTIVRDAKETTVIVTLGVYPGT